MLALACTKKSDEPRTACEACAAALTQCAEEAGGMDDDTGGIPMDSGTLDPSAILDNRLLECPSESDEDQPDWYVDFYICMRDAVTNNDCSRATGLLALSVAAGECGLNAGQDAN